MRSATTDTIPDVEWGLRDVGSRFRRCTCHAALTLATDLKMCLRLVLIPPVGTRSQREHQRTESVRNLPKGTQITTQPHLGRHR